MREGIDCKGVAWKERALSPLMRDITGKMVERLTALFPVEGVGKSRSVRWLCQCVCGNQVVYQSGSLQRGTAKSCGCLSREQTNQANYNKRQSLIGEKFNKLTIIDVSEIKIGKDGAKRAYYKCLCDCGNPTPIIIRGTDVKLGKTMSCGCAKSEAEARKREDLTGKRFSSLVVLNFAYVKNEASYWNCQCNCGTIKTIKGALLTSGHAASCGCSLSIGEANIKRILNDNHVNYLHDRKYFEDLTSDAGVPLRYDFIILNDTGSVIRLIEFDGPQHSEPSSLFGENEFTKLQFHDNLKNQYALSHNLPLVRIPYKERDNITLDLIMGDKYLFTETAQVSA